MGAPERRSADAIHAQPMAARAGACRTRRLAFAHRLAPACD